MTEYHGWTHAPKSAGGTDPIPGLGGGISSIIVVEGTSDISWTNAGLYEISTQVFQGVDSFADDAGNYDLSPSTYFKILHGGFYYFQPILYPRVLYAEATGYEFQCKVKDASNVAATGAGRWMAQRLNAFDTSSAFWYGVLRDYAGPSGGSDQEVIDINSSQPLPSTILWVLNGDNLPLSLHIYLTVYVGPGNQIASTDTNAPQLRVGFNMIRLGDSPL